MQQKNLVSDDRLFYPVYTIYDNINFIFIFRLFTVRISFLKVRMKLGEITQNQSFPKLYLELFFSSSFCPFNTFSSVPCANIT